MLNKIFRPDFVWDTLKSPRTIALLKLGAAIVGVIHAIDEFQETSNAESKKSKSLKIYL